MIGDKITYHKNKIIPRPPSPILEHQIEICPICREPDNLIIDVCKCGVGYHQVCWDTWKKTNPSCPTCRAVNSNQLTINDYHEEVWLEFINNNNNNIISQEIKTNNKIMCCKIAILLGLLLFTWYFIYYYI